MYRIQSTTETYLYDNSYTYPAGSQGMFSASRRFNAWVPQKVYATYKTNNTAFQHYAEWLYLPHDVGTFLVGLAAWQKRGIKHGGRT